MENSNENKGLSLQTLSNIAKFDHVQGAQNIAQDIKEGLVDPLTVVLVLKRMEKLAEEFKKVEDIKYLIEKEASKHTQDGKTFPYMGVKMTLGSVHTSYDFSKCNDILWDNLNEIFQKVSQMKKDRETFLKAAFPDNPKFGFKSPKVIVDNVYSLEELDCGEEVALNAPIKIQQTGVKITFPKK